MLTISYNIWWGRNNMKCDCKWNHNTGTVEINQPIDPSAKNPINEVHVSDWENQHIATDWDVIYETR